MNLYEIDKAIEAVYDNAVDENGEISEEAIRQLEELNLARETKIENVALWHKNLLAEVNAIRAEIDNLAARKKSLERKMEWQKQYLEYALDGNKFETPKVAISYRKSTTVEFGDIDKFVADHKGEEFIKVRTDYSPDKVLIKDLLKKGEQIEGVQLVEHLNMQVK